MHNDSFIATMCGHIGMFRQLFQTFPLPAELEYLSMIGSLFTRSFHSKFRKCVVKSKTSHVV